MVIITVVDKMGGRNSHQIQHSKSIEWERDYKNFQAQQEEAELKIKEIEKDLQREQHDLDNLREDGIRNHLCRTQGKKTFKEINELVKQERAKCTLKCEKSYVQKKQEITKLKLPHQRELEHLLLRQLGILEEEKQAEQHSNGVVNETSIATEVEQEADKNALQSVQNELVTVRKNIRILEGQEMTFSKQLDAIKNMYTNSKATVEMPTEELTQNDKKLDADFTNFEEQEPVIEKKARTFKDALKRERENYELKLSELKTEVHDNKKTEEIMKMETVNLGRIFRKKELEIGQELTMVQLLYFREGESLCMRRMDFFEELEVFNRAKGGGGTEEEKSKLQKALLLCREQKEEVQSDLSLIRENIRVLEKDEMSMNQELDATLDMPTEELAQKDKELDADLINFQTQESETQQKVHTFKMALKREQENHELKLRELKTEVYKNKKTLKELGEIMKRETVNLERIFQKKELEIKQEALVVRMLHFQEAESLCMRQIGLVEEVEVFHLEKVGGGNEEEERKLQKVLLFFREQKEEYQKQLSTVRENIRVVEEEELSIDEQLDAINKLMDSYGEGTTIALNLYLLL